MARSSRRVRKNTVRPRGFPWPEAQPLYHSTVAVEQVLEEGLRTRSELSNRLHATGGGPDTAISFTLNRDVARAICVGLRTLVRCAAGEMLLGDLIIAAQQIAPQATAYQIKAMQLTAEKVDRIDRGLRPVRAGHFRAEGSSVKMDTLLDHVERDPSSFEGVDKIFAPNGRLPYAVTAWTTVQKLLAMTKGGEADLSKDLRADTCFELYKGVLGMGGAHKSIGGFQEVYDPLFFMTSAARVSHLREDQIGIVSCRLAAKWLCASARNAEDMGFNTAGLWLGDWSESCEFALSSGTPNRSPTQEWDPPDPTDTLVYLGPAMSEIRSYDTSLTTHLELAETIGSILQSCEEEWRAKGVAVEDPVAWPYFFPGTPHLAS